ncbi:MAG: hypothetical protein R2771_15910 [Saprospiraceae bacterium]
MKIQTDYIPFSIFLNELIRQTEKNLKTLNKSKVEWFTKKIFIEKQILEKLAPFKNSKEPTENKLAKFFDTNKDTFFYKKHYLTLHQRIIQIYNQKNVINISDENFDEKIGQVFTALNAGCSTIINNSFLIDTSVEKFAYFIKNKISQKKKNSLNPYIEISTVDRYSSIVYFVWTNKYSLSDISKRDSSTKKEQKTYIRSASDLIEDYLPVIDPYIKKYNQNVRDDIKTDKEDHNKTDNESLDIDTDQETDITDDDESNLEKKNHYLSLKDNIPSIDRYEVLKINQLHKLHQYFNKLKNSTDLDQQSFRLMFYMMLFLRRSPTFLSSIKYVSQTNSNKKLKTDIDNYPLLDIDDQVIYYKPKHLFSPTIRDYENKEKNEYLKNKENFETWNDLLPFYNNAHFIAGIPLPPFLIEMIKKYDNFKKYNNIDSSYLFIWKGQDGFTNQLDNSKFNDPQKQLFSELNIERYLYENIYRTFDAYMKYFGLGLVDAYLISERHRIPHEICIRYTSISLKILANNYFLASQRWFNAIRSNYLLSDYQPHIDSTIIKNMPAIRMGSWRALEPRYCKEITSYLSSSRALEIPMIQTKPGYQNRNIKVVKAIFHLFILNGLRPFEITRLQRSWLSLEKPTLLVNGKAEENARLIPLHDLLYNELKSLLKFKKEKPNQLFWMYDEKWAAI